MLALYDNIMFPSHHNRQLSSAPSQNSYLTYGYHQPPQSGAQYGQTMNVADINCNQMFQMSHQLGPMPSDTMQHQAWHHAPSMYSPLPSPQCSRGAPIGMYDDWTLSQSPSSISHSITAGNNSQPGPIASPTNFGGYKFNLPSALASGHSGGLTHLDYSGIQDLSGPMPGHRSPDSGLTASSDGVSSTGSPHNGLPPQPTISSPPRPQQPRSPYEWIKKSSYQSQPATGSCPTLFHHTSKTRTKDKYRVVYTDQQRVELEKEFHFSRYITIRRKSELASMLGLSERQVKIWFQNRRAKERKQVKKREEMVHKEKIDSLTLSGQISHPSLHQNQTIQHSQQNGNGMGMVKMEPILCIPTD